jgi:hypothetical protein
MPCSLVDGYQRIASVSIVYHEDGGSTFLRNVGNHLNIRCGLSPKAEVAQKLIQFTQSNFLPYCKVKSKYKEEKLHCNLYTHLYTDSKNMSKYHERKVGHCIVMMRLTCGMIIQTDSQ